MVNGNKLKQKKKKKDHSTLKRYITLVHVNVSIQMHRPLLCASIIKWNNYVMPAGKDVTNLV